MSDPNPFDRIMEPLRAIIREEVSKLSYLGTWQYSVVGVNGDNTINATATDDGAPMPNLNNLVVVSGPEGSTGTPTIGNFCYVRFINGDPTRPVVVGNQAVARTVTVDATETVKIGPSVSNAVQMGGGDAPIARMGDTVSVYFLTGPTPIAGMVFPPVPPGSFTGTITFIQPATGVITSGQAKVIA